MEDFKAANKLLDVIDLLIQCTNTAAFCDVI